MPGEISPVEESYADKANGVLKAYPALATDPVTVHALASTPGVDGYTLGQNAKLADHIKAVKDTVVDHATSDKHANGFWGDVSNAVHGFASGTFDMLKGTAGMLNRAVVTTGEIGSFGLLGSKGIGDFTANLNDAADTVKNAVNIPKDWGMGKQSIAFLESMEQRHGTAYSVAYGLPAILAAVFGDEAVFGGEAGAIGSDTARMAQLASKVESGTASPDDLTAYTAAATRAARKSNATSVATDAADSNLEEAAAKSDVVDETAPLEKKISAFERGKNFTQPIVKYSIGPFAKVASAGLKATSNSKLFATYAALQQQANADPATRALWEAVVDGIPVDAQGNKIHLSMGQGLAEMLGQHQGIGYDILRDTGNFAQGAINVGAFLSSDPLAPISEARAAAQSATGVGGILGRWWGGLGVETGADVVRTAGKTAQNRRAYQYMADHSEQDIRKAFKGMYSDAMYRKLGEAKTWEEVVGIHADIADGAALAGYVAPTLKIWRVAGRALLDTLQVARPNESFEEMVSLLDEELRANKLPGVTQDDLLKVADADLNSIMRGSVRRQLAKYTTESIWKIGEAEAKGEIPYVSNYVFRLGDKSTIPVFQRMFQMSGMFSPVSIKAFGDYMRLADTPEKFANSLMNATTAMMEGALSKATDATKYQALQDFFLPQMRQDIENLYSFRGGGALDNLYSNGIKGDSASLFQNPENPLDRGSYGLGYLHIRQGRFIDPRQLTGMIKTYRSMIDGMDTSIVGKAQQLREADAATMERVAKFKKATIGDFEKEMGDLLATRSKAYVEAGNISSAQGFRDGYETAKSISDGASSLPNMSNPQKFVQFAKKLSDEVIKTAQDLRIASDRLDEYEALKQQADQATLANAANAGQLRAELGQMTTISPDTVNQLKGRLQALNDIETRVYAKVSEPGTTIKSYEDLAKNLGFPDLGYKSAPVRQAIVDKLAKNRVKNINYLNSWNRAADAMNRGISYIFIPQALSTVGYLLRVATSEVLPNIFRMGPSNFIESRLMASITKHELNNLPLQEGAVRVGSKVNDVEVVSEKKLIAQHTMKAANLLMDKTEYARKFFIGALTGAERGIVQAMSPERFERMLADFSDALQMGGGHIADIGHKTSQLYGTTKTSVAMSSLSYGLNEEGNAIVKGQRFISDKFGRVDKGQIATALSNNLKMLHSDQMFNPIVKDIDEMVKRFGTAGYGGVRYDQAFNDLINKQYNRLSALPEEVLSSFGAYGKLLSDESTGNSLRDFAKAQVYNVWNVLSGSRSVEKLGTEYVFHPELIEQALSGTIKSEPQLAADYAKSRGLYPMNLIDRIGTRYSWETEGARNMNKLFKVALDTPRLLNEVFLDKPFGHLISWMSREPIFLWEYHVAMEEFRNHVAGGLMSLDQAQVMGMNRAFTRLARYVHNPADRFAFEQYTRIYSPFWFAKNQAYRRSFRLLEEDPGAFVKYLRVCLGMTQYFNTIASKNNSYLAFPGGALIAHFAANLFAGSGIMGAFFTNLGFSVLGDPSSVQTVDPLGPTTGPSMLENILRPDPGPYLSAVTKVSAQFLYDNHIIDAQQHADVLRVLLGKIGSQTGLMSDILPSSFWRNTYTAASDLAMTLAGHQITGDAVAQVQAEAMHEAFTNMMTMYVNEYLAMHNVKVANDTDYVNARTYADQQISTWMNTGDNQQVFMERAHTVAMAMYIAKNLAGFLLPLAPSLKANFATTSLNKYVNMKMPDGTTIPYSEAVNLFAMNHPREFIDTISGSTSPYGPFSETQQFAQWNTKAPELLSADSGVPNLMAYLVPRDGKYLPGLFQVQVGMGLRSSDTPQQYVDAVLTQLGNDYYYNNLIPQFYTQYGYYNPANPNDPNNQISANGYKLLKAAAQNWGITYNPTWMKNGSPFGVSSKSNEAKAVDQLQTFLSTPSMVNKVVGTGLMTKNDVDVLTAAYYLYNQAITNIKSTTSSSGKWGYEQELYQQMNGLAADPTNKNIAYFLSSVLAKAPTK